MSEQNSSNFFSGKKSDLSDFKFASQEKIQTYFNCAQEDFMKTIDEYKEDNAFKVDKIKDFMPNSASFKLDRSVVKELTRPIRKYLKYKKITSIECNISCENKRLRGIIIMFEKPKESKQDNEKKVSIYFDKIYDSRVSVRNTTAGPLGFFQTFKSKDQELESIARPFFKHMYNEIREIFGEKPYVKTSEKFKKRIL